MVVAGRRIDKDSAMFTTFPPRKEAEDWVLVPVFSGLPTLFSHFTSNICKNIRSSNLKIDLRKQPTFRASYEGQVQEFPLMTCHDHFPDG